MVVLVHIASCLMYSCTVFSCQAVKESVRTLPSVSRLDMLLVLLHHQAAPQTNFPLNVKGTPSLSQTHVSQERLDTLSLQQATTESIDKRGLLLLTRLPIRTTKKRRWSPVAVMLYFSYLSEKTLQYNQESTVFQKII